MPGSRPCFNCSFISLTPDCNAAMNSVDLPSAFKSVTTDSTRVAILSIALASASGGSFANNSPCFLAEVLSTATNNGATGAFSVLSDAWFSACDTLALSCCASVSAKIDCCSSFDSRGFGTRYSSLLTTLTSDSLAFSLPVSKVLTSSSSNSSSKVLSASAFSLITSAFSTSGIGTFCGSTISRGEACKKSLSKLASSAF
mmetsp:Transcript_25756/g.81706  ORF Transcript_25756/g.81706 Transcript_25756/m.81706 type:complete len:200 (+) Transcript_25756:3575-4174(+)